MVNYFCMGTLCRVLCEVYSVHFRVGQFHTYNLQMLNTQKLPTLLYIVQCTQDISKVHTGTH